MRIFVLHNSYRCALSGEDEVAAAEGDLLQSKGHAVFRYHVSSESIGRNVSEASAAVGAFWNSGTYRELRLLFSRLKPDIAHFHNIFPLISPAAYYAARAENVKVVQTLHNFRVLCASSMFYRRGSCCEDCLGRAVPLPALAYACYRNSRRASAVVAGMAWTHRWAGTWRRAVDLYIALTRFSRRKFIEGGLPEDRIEVKPNFARDEAGMGSGRGGYALFVGRLSPEKGIDLLLEAWRRLDMPLKIAGDGPLSERVRESALTMRHVEYLGRCGKPEIIALMQAAAFLVVPSLVYENFPVVIAEAFSVGLPVLGSAHGSMAEILGEDRAGFTFRPGDAEDLARKAAWILAAPAWLSAMRLRARSAYLMKYNAEENYRQLMALYERALGAPQIDYAPVLQE